MLPRRPIEEIQEEIRARIWPRGITEQPRMLTDSTEAMASYNRYVDEQGTWNQVPPPIRYVQWPLADFFFFDSEGRVRREGETYGSVDSDSDSEGGMPRLLQEQSWSEIMEEEERIMEEDEPPRWMPGCYKARMDKEDGGNEEEEDKDGEGTLSRQATLCLQDKKGRNQAHQNYQASKATTNFLQEPRATTAIGTKEAP
jgi:hypothetical protein